MRSTVWGKAQHIDVSLHLNWPVGTNKNTLKKQANDTVVWFSMLQSRKLSKYCGAVRS